MPKIGEVIASGLGIVASPATGVITAITNILDKVLPSAKERAEAQAILEKIKQAPELLDKELEKQRLEREFAAAHDQTEVNKLEAQSASLLVSGWRPFIGWVCGIALGYVWIGRPFIHDLCNVFGYNPEFSVIDTDNMLQLVIALLGLGVYRTFEKVRGVSR